MSKIFSWIGDLFTKIWKLIKRVLPYIMIALAAYFTFGGSYILLGMTLEGYAAAVACIGVSFLAAPEETTDVVGGLAEDIGGAAGTIVAGGVGGLLSGLTSDSSFLWIVAIAVGAYFLLKRKDESQEIGQLNGRDDGAEVVVAKADELTVRDSTLSPYVGYQTTGGQL